MQCLVCDHIWSATPLSKRQAWLKTGYSGCPNCARLRKTGGLTEAERIASVCERIEQAGYTIITPPSDGSDRSSATTVTVMPPCGHEWKTSPVRILHNKNGCYECNKAEKAARLNESSITRSAMVHERISEWASYKYEVRRLSERNAIEAGLDLSRRGRAGVVGATQLDHVVSVRKCFDAGVPANVCAHASNLAVIPWRDNITKRTKVGIIPPQILPYLVSDANSIQTLAAEVRAACASTDWTVEVEPHQVTIVVSPHLRASIKMLSMHVQQLRPYRANLDELRQFEQQGIVQLQFFRDEWNESQLLIIQKLRYMSGQFTGHKVHGRQCTLDIVSPSQKKRFLERFHIQGNVRGKFNVGAWHNDVLVAVAVFDVQKKMNSGTATPDVLELVRLCVHSDFIVPGINSRLVSFVRRVAPSTSTIITYRDIRNTTGTSYDRMGFKKIRQSGPSYKYVVGGVREHRWKFRKSALGIQNTDTTEYEHMLQQGYDRVWDCGTERYELSLT